MKTSNLDRISYVLSTDLFNIINIKYNIRKLNIIIKLL